MRYILPLVIVITFFLVFLYSGRKTIYRGADWFKKSQYDKTWWMLLSLLATNLTISGGIIASISGSHFYGLWFFLAPASAAAGLIAFAMYHKRLSKYYKSDKFFLSDISKGEFSPVLFAFGGAAIAIGSFIAGWEIHVASQAIASYYEINYMSGNIFFVSLVIAVMAGWYISKGGWHRSVFTDIIQSISVLFFLILVGYLLISLKDSKFVFPTLKISSTVSLWLFGIALFINNIGYSLVSPNNWQIAQSSNGMTKKLFVTGAAILFLFSTAIFLLSGYIPLGNPFYIFSTKHFLTVILVALVPLFTWSTIDTSSVALSNLAESMQSGFKLRENESESLRLFPILFLIVAVFVSYLLYTFQPNIFISLLAATSSFIVFVPVIYAGLFTDNTAYLRSAQCGIVMFVLFVTVIVVSVGMTMAGIGEYIFALSLAGFVASMAITWYYNKKVKITSNAI